MYAKLAACCTDKRKGSTRLLIALLSLLFLIFGLVLANLNDRAVPYNRVKPYIHTTGIATSSDMENERDASSNASVGIKEIYSTDLFQIYPETIQQAESYRDRYGIICAYSSNWADSDLIRSELSDGVWFTEAPKEEGVVHVVVANSSKTHYQVGDMIEGYNGDFFFDVKMPKYQLRVCGVLKEDSLFQHLISTRQLLQISDFWRNSTGTDLLMAASLEEIQNTFGFSPLSHSSWLRFDSRASMSTYLENHLSGDIPLSDFDRVCRREVYQNMELWVPLLGSAALLWAIACVFLISTGLYRQGGLIRLCAAYGGKWQRFVRTSLVASVRLILPAFLLGTAVAGLLTLTPLSDVLHLRLGWSNLVTPAVVAAVLCILTALPAVLPLYRLAPERRSKCRDACETQKREGVSG